MVAATEASDRSAFSAWVAEEDGRAVLRLAGELDFTVLALLERALAGVPAGPGQLLTVDAAHLGFMDVSGVRLLIATDVRLRAAGGPGLAVRAATPIVRRVFEVMAVTSLLASPGAADLDLARQAAGMTVTELFVAYFALGGTAELAALSAFLAGYPAALDVHQRQLAAQAVNERLLDLGLADRLLSVHPTEKGRGHDWT